MIKCVIFDCDGTLVDSEYLCNLGLEIKLAEYGIELSAIDLLARFRGGKLSVIIETIAIEHNISLKDDFISTYRTLVDRLFEEELKPCKGVPEALDNLTLAKCVASNGPIAKIKKALSVTGLAEYFNDNIYSAYDIDSWKPDPGIFLHVANEMGFQPNQCAVVEDSKVGIMAAQSAGMRPILYDPDNIRLISCSRTIGHMSELHSVIT